MEPKWKNWKSTLAFFIFVGIYIYSVTADKAEGVVETAGYVALVASILMMFRSQVTTEMLKTLVDNVSKKG